LKLTSSHSSPKERSETRASLI